MRPPCLRTALYVPGSNPRALAKIPTLDADAYILDLEDAVAPEAKVSARQRVREALDAGVAPPVVLAATHEETLAVVTLEDLERHATR